jgi:hypothetical protein
MQQNLLVTGGFLYVSYKITGGFLYLSVSKWPLTGV